MNSERNPLFQRSIRRLKRQTMCSLKKKYDSGASIRALAEETGRSYGFVHRMLSESGVTLRGRGGATRGKKATSA